MSFSSEKPGIKLFFLGTDVCWDTGRYLAVLLPVILVPLFLIVTIITICICIQKGKPLQFCAMFIVYISKTTQAQ